MKFIVTQFRTLVACGLMLCAGATSAGELITDLPKALAAGRCFSRSLPVAGCILIFILEPTWTPSVQTSNCPMSLARTLKSISRRPSMENEPSSWLNTEVLCRRSRSWTEYIRIRINKTYFFNKINCIIKIFFSFTRISYYKIARKFNIFVYSFKFFNNA